MSRSLADLHRHLDGSLRPETVGELAAELGLNVPRELVFYPGMGLAEALARFAFTLQLLQQPAAVSRVAAEICEDATAEGVSCLEIRFAPQLHGGGSIEAIVDAALDGIAGRAGLLLCGLYGEAPARFDELVEVARSRSGVVGIDLAGGPAPDHRWSMVDYAPAFCRARDLGIGRTVHAGEGRPPDEIRLAIECLHAQRIGHGTTLLDDPSVVELVLERDITIEACVTSNWHVGAIDSIESHPIVRWLERGVRVCVCTDNTLLSAVDAPRELERVSSLVGMSPERVRTVIRYGHEASFQRK